jgi:hypothetical protein
MQWAGGLGTIHDKNLISQGLILYGHGIIIQPYWYYEKYQK